MRPGKLRLVVLDRMVGIVQIFTQTPILVALMGVLVMPIPATQFMVAQTEPVTAILFTAVQMAIQTLIQFMVVLMGAAPLTLYRINLMQVHDCCCDGSFGFGQI